MSLETTNHANSEQECDRIVFKAPQSKINNNTRPYEPTPSPLKGPKNKWKKSYTRNKQASETTSETITQSTDPIDTNNTDKENIPEPKTPTKKDNRTNERCLKRKIISPLSNQSLVSKSDSQARFLSMTNSVSSCGATGVMTSPDTARLAKRVAFSKTAKDAVPQYPRQVKTALKFTF
jgi:hypothetical protein